MAANDAEEDDYLTMTFEDPSQAKKETSLQRRDRLAKTVSDRGRQPTKAEKAAKERADLEASLSKQLDASNKGAQMLAKMGFKGGALGKRELTGSDDDGTSGGGTSGARGLTQPIGIAMKNDRGGIGLDAERKRKFDNAAAGLEAIEKLSAEEFRAAKRVAREERRVEGAMWAAMKTLEEVEEGKGDGDGDGGEGREERLARPLKAVNLLYRPLVRQRVEREGEGRMRADMMRGLARSSGGEGSETEDEKPEPGTEVVEDLEKGDPEMEEFELLGFAERLDKITKYLREKHRFCFWCKYQYPDEAMEGCPGLTEEDHD